MAACVCGLRNKGKEVLEKRRIEPPVFESLERDIGSVSSLHLSVLSKAVSEPAQIGGGGWCSLCLFLIPSVFHKAARMIFKWHLSAQNLQWLVGALRMNSVVLPHPYVGLHDLPLAVTPV